MKTDFKKTLPGYAAKRNEFSVVDLPVMQYLMVDGLGDPGSSPQFQAAIEALYPMAFTLKFMSKQDLGKDYVVPPLEGLWWADDMAAFTTARDKSQWEWTVMIMTPDWITSEMVEMARAKVVAKKNPASLPLLRLDTLDEGTCIQTLHVGPFEDEGPLLREMHDDFIPANGFRMVGHHHEIYLSDFRKVVPDKLRTILRQPVAKT